MEKEATLLTVEAIINAPLEKTWNYWTQPEHIIHWCFASVDWHAPSATNDLKVGGKSNTRMEAKDGSVGFDFEGEYTEVVNHELIAYKLADERTVRIEFLAEGNTTKIIERFVAELENPLEMQQQGWQAILNNFKKYTETH
ncbi:SRPBCC family protein [soil metagenome]